MSEKFYFIKKNFPFILLFFSFILELLNIPYLNKSSLLIVHIISSLSFSISLYILSDNKIKGIIWSVSSLIICSYVNILGIIIAGILFIMFKTISTDISRKEILYALLLFTALVVIFFYDIIFLGKTLKCTNTIPQVLSTGVYGQENNYISSIPVLDTSSAVEDETEVEYKKKNYRKGNMPLWNPYQAGGYPFLASMRSSMFNPFEIINYILPSKYSWDVYLLFRLFFSGLFMYLYMRELTYSFPASLTSAIAYMFSAPVIIYINDIQLNPSMLFPVLFFIMEKLYQNQSKKNIIATSSVIALLIFSGFPEHVTMISIIGVGYFLFRSATGKEKILKSFGNISLAFTLGILTGFIVIIPLIEFLFFNGWTNHAPGTGLKSINLTKILYMFIPYFKQAFYQYYIGIIPFLLIFLAFTGKKDNKIIYYFGTVLFLLTGKIFGLPLINMIGYIPVLNLIHFPYNTGQLLAFIVSILTGTGIEQIYSGKIKPFFVYITVLICITLISLPHIIYPSDIFNNLVYGHIFIKFILLFSALLLYICFKNNHKKTAIIFSVILSIEMFSFIPRERLKRLESFPEVPYIQFLKKEQLMNNSRGRVYGIGGTLYPNIATVYEIDDLGFYLPVFTDNFTKFFNKLVNPEYFTDRFFPALRQNIDFKNEMLNILNLEYLLLPAELYIDDSNWKQIYSGEINIYRNIRALPRVFIVHRAVFLKSDQKTLDFLKENQGNLNKICVIYDEEIPEKPDFPPHGSNARIIKYDTDEVIINASMKKAGFLIFNDIYYPGWKVFVDNKEEKIYRTNFLFRSVFLKEGDHTVRFVFFPYSYYTGKIISLAVIYILFIMIGKRVSKKL